MGPKKDKYSCLYLEASFILSKMNLIYSISSLGIYNASIHYYTVRESSFISSISWYTCSKKF